MRPCSRWGLPCRERYRSRGGLLPRLFTLTRAGEPAWAVCFLWHSPRGHPHRALPGTLLCGARTFLPRGRTEVRPHRRSPDPLRHQQHKPSAARVLPARRLPVFVAKAAKPQAAKGGRFDEPSPLSWRSWRLGVCRPGEPAAGHTTVEKPFASAGERGQAARSSAGWVSLETSWARSFFLTRLSSWRARSRETPRRRPISARESSSSSSAIMRASTM
jgi:hypothetical protein